LFAKGGESSFKGLISHSKYLFLAIYAKGGESISPKQKDRSTTLVLAQSKRTTPPPYFKIIFQFGILLCSKGGDSSIFKIDILKPS
jgi:hypothetical protein